MNQAKICPKCGIPQQWEMWRKCPCGYDFGPPPQTWNERHDDSTARNRYRTFWPQARIFDTRVGILILTFLFALAVLCFGSSFHLWQEERRILNFGVGNTATLESKNERITRTGYGYQAQEFHDYILLIRFSAADGTTQKKSLVVSPAVALRLNVGESMPITYIPKQPDVVRLADPLSDADERTRKMNALLGGFFFTALGVVLIYISTKPGWPQ